MLKYCENCGQEMDENAACCPLCAAENKKSILPTLRESAYQSTDAFYTENNQKKKKKILLLSLAGLVCLTLVVLSVVWLVIPQPKDPISLAVTIATKDNFKKLEDFYPEAYWTYQKEELDMTVEDEIASCSDEYHQAYVRFYKETYGADFKVSYKLTNTEDIGQRMLGKLQNEFEKRYSISKKDLAEGRKLSLTFTISGSKGEYSTSGDFYVVKLDGKWYGVNENGFVAPDFVFDTLLDPALEEAYYVIYDEIMYAES